MKSDYNTVDCFRVTMFYWDSKIIKNISSIENDLNSNFRMLYCNK